MTSAALASRMLFVNGVLSVHLLRFDCVGVDRRKCLKKFRQ
jgi:hypothetical protein